MAKDHRDAGSGSPVTAPSKRRKGHGTTTTGQNFGEIVGFAAARGIHEILDQNITAVERSLSKRWIESFEEVTEHASERVKAVLQSAANEGLTLAKDGRIAGRVSADLINAAKAQTGLQSDTDLIEFALANVALKDNFAQVFRNVKGTVDPDLDLGF